MDQNTIAEFSKNIGKKAKWKIPKTNLMIEVVIKDVEIFFEKPFYIVSPIAGTGRQRVRDYLEIEK